LESIGKVIWICIEVAGGIGGFEGVGGQLKEEAGFGVFEGFEVHLG